ncbi:MAG: hypothetical protein CM1200mP18_22220 [Gammaproteobacteria bacterium]|nr:MAG: hypothetical protein CM1200mP18_22220 [Gammaproteobacteria bacterium]
MCEAFVDQVTAGNRKLIINISSGNGSLTLKNGIGIIRTTPEGGIKPDQQRTSSGS